MTGLRAVFEIYHVKSAQGQFFRQFEFEERTVFDGGCYGRFRNDGNADLVDDEIFNAFRFVKPCRNMQIFRCQAEFFENSVNMRLTAAAFIA